MLPKTAIELRKTIRSFGGERFNTTELRKKRDFTNLLAELRQMVKDGELKHMGIVRHNSAWVDSWQELNLTIIYSAEEIDPRPDMLPGWRDIHPELFADIVHPWMPVRGLIRNFAEM